MNTPVINRYSKQNLVFQLIFWSTLFLFILAKDYGEYTPQNFSEIFGYDLCHLIFQIISANFFYFVLIRYFLSRRKYALFIISVIVSLYILSVLNRLFIVYVGEPFFIDIEQDSVVSIITDLKYLFFSYSFSLLTASFVFISVMYMLNYKNEKQNTLRLLKEKAELELKSLKTQLNPHFLFNTLNNIYSLSLINSEKTPESLSRLANILDYILYKGQQDFVPLSDELKLIDDYIELEKLRYDDRLIIHKSLDVHYPNTIPPLLYLSLVENAFKHGASKTKGEVRINIAVRTGNDKTTFEVENTCSTNSSYSGKGIGLKNITEQLRLAYKNNFEFTTSQADGIFKVILVTP